MTGVFSMFRGGGSRASSQADLLSSGSATNYASAGQSEGGSSAPGQPDVLAVLWESKWFGCGAAQAEARSNTSDNSSSRGYGSQTSISSRQDTSGNARAALSSPIVFNSRLSEEGPPVAVTRMRNTPLAPNRVLQHSDSGGLGTWTTRQTTFLEDVPENSTTTTTAAAQGHTPGSIVATWLREEAAAQQQAAAGAHAALQSEDAVEDAAWRWRFARRWHAEQTRDIDPADASTSDRCDDAQYLGGRAWGVAGQVSDKLTVARTVSSELGSCLIKNGSIVGVDLLLFDSEGGWAASRGDKDRMLSQHQSRVERSEQQQHQTRAGKLIWDVPMASNTTLLPTVEIDAWGTFRFMLVKLCDVGGGQERLLVRGHNHCSDASLVEDINRKVMQLSGIQAGALLVLGGGVMEWRRDRDRSLRMHTGYCADSSQRGASTAEELLSLTAALVKESLPPGYSVMVGGAA